LEEKGGSKRPTPSSKETKKKLGSTKERGRNLTKPRLHHHWVYQRGGALIRRGENFPGTENRNPCGTSMKKGQRRRGKFCHTTMSHGERSRCPKPEGGVPTRKDTC